MATIKTNDGKGTEVIITGPEALKDVKNLDFTDKQIDAAVARATMDLEKEKGSLNPHGQVLVHDTQTLLENTRRQELLQKLYNFALKGQEQVKGGPSSDLKDTSRTLLNQVSGVGGSLRTDVTDVSGYIRSSLYNYLTSSEYRELASDFFTIIKMLAAEVKDDQKLDRHLQKGGQTDAAHDAARAFANRTVNVGSTQQTNVTATLDPTHDHVASAAAQAAKHKGLGQDQSHHTQNVQYSGGLHQQQPLQAVGQLPMPPKIPEAVPAVPIGGTELYQATHQQGLNQPAQTDVHIHQHQGPNQPLQTDVHIHQNLQQQPLHPVTTSQTAAVANMHTGPTHLPYQPGLEQIAQQHQNKHQVAMGAMDLESRRKELEEREIEDIERRLNTFLERVGEKKEYQQLVENFFTYSDQLTNILLDATEKSKQTPEAQQVRSLLDQAFELLADFAGKKLAARYRQDWINLATKFKQDKELKVWRKSVRVYILETLKNPRLDDEDRNIDQARQLVREGRRVLRKYKKPINILYEDQAKIARKIRNDPDLQEFQRNLSTLGTHLACNDQGRFDPMVLQESMGQITKLLANLFHRYLSNIPVEKVEVYSPKFDAILSDIKITGTGFAPDRIEVGTSSNSSFSFVQGQKSRSSMQLSFSVNQINPAFKNFNYHVTKKSFPHFEDHGVASVETGEGGLSVHVVIKIKSGRGDLPAKASVYKVDTTLAKMRVSIDKSRDHKILAPMAAPLLGKVLQSRLQTAIDSSLRARFDDVVIQLNKWFATHPMDRALQSTKGTASKMLPSTHGDGKISPRHHSHGKVSPRGHSHEGKHQKVGEKQAKVAEKDKKVAEKKAEGHHGQAAVAKGEKVKAKGEEKKAKAEPARSS